MGVATFNNGFLLVGERVKDWSEVWYKPRDSEHQDSDAKTDLPLYSSSTGGPQPREPMVGEVKWFSQFDIKNMESSNKQEQRVMQEQTLLDAWTYMNEMDEREVRVLEQEFNRPNERRWQSWFVHAVRAKRLQFKRVAEAAGAPTVPGDDIDDSLYGTDFENHMQKTIHKRGRLMQPPRRGPLDRKRKGTGNGTNARKQKKQKSTNKHVDTAKITDELEQDEEVPLMSGGAGRSGSTEPLRYAGHDLTRPNGMAYLLEGMSKYRRFDWHSDTSSRFSNEPEDIPDDDDADTDGISDVFDASPPEGPGSSGVGSVPSPGSRLGNGLTGFVRRRQQIDLQRAKSDPIQGSAGPTQPGLRHLNRKGSVIDGADRVNNGMSDEDALRLALQRSSMTPNVSARMREETRASLERDYGMRKTRDRAEVQQDVQDLPGDPDEPKG